MRKKVGFLLLILLFLWGCKKEKDNENSNNTNVKDSILYTEVNPVKIIGFDNLPEHKGWFCDLNNELAAEQCWASL